MAWYLMTKPSSLAVDKQKWICLCCQDILTAHPHFRLGHFRLTTSGWPFQVGAISGWDLATSGWATSGWPFQVGPISGWCHFRLGYFRLGHFRLSYAHFRLGHFRLAISGWAHFRLRTLQVGPFQVGPFQVVFRPFQVEFRPTWLISVFLILPILPNLT